MPNPIISNLVKFVLSGSLLCFFCFFKKGYAYERRETIERHHLHQTHIVQISSLLPATVCKPSTKVLNNGASLTVVHKHGPCSQLNQDKANAAPNLTQILLHDQSRVDSIQSRITNNSDGDSLKDSQATLPAKSGLSIDTGNYIVTLGLGTPKKDLTLVFDTGSDLSWTQCEPCAGYCYKQLEPIFDPSESKSYSNITCSSAECTQLTSATGNSPRCLNSTCIYRIGYGDGSYTIGFFGKETLALTSADVFDNFLFGCGQNNDGLFGGTAGLLGLGRDKLSIVSQTSQKYASIFSYCLPSTSSSTGYLTFGNSGRVSSTMTFTPLLTNSKNPSFYFLDMIAISVGGRKLSIATTVFSTAGTIIDSGTVITRLPPTAYAALRSAFREMMSSYPMTQPVSILDTCYDLSQNNSVTIPKISFYFSGGAMVDLDQLGILISVQGATQVCLAFAGNSNDNNVAILGNFQQKTLDVVYDVAGGRLGFGPGGCD